jgi:ketosteroid isomerase-like protein
MYRPAVLLVAAALICAGTARAQQDVQQQILAAEKSWFEAFLRGDASTVAKMETDDFVAIQDGQMADKPQQTASIQQRRPIQQNRNSDVIRLMQNGDTAVLIKRDTVTVGSDSERQLVSEVWVRNNGSWKIAHFHVSAIKQ